VSEHLRDRLADALAYRPGASAYDYADRVLPIVTSEIRESMHVAYAAGLDIAEKFADDVERIGALMPKPGEYVGNCCEHCAAIEDFLITECLR
jgi:hypothetical protein